MTTNIVPMIAGEAARRKKGNTPPPSVEDDRVEIQYDPDQVSVIIDKIEDLLIPTDIYRFGNRVVCIAFDDLRVAGGQSERIQRLHEVSEANLTERIGLVARFVKWDKRSKGFAQCGVPRELAEKFLARSEWRLKKLLGVVTAPTLRSDGTVLDIPGYDDQTGLVFEPLGVKFPVIDHMPCREDAIDALHCFERLLRGYRFLGAADLSVALSAILTAVVRRALAVAPLHCFSAPVAGCGKSKLIDTVSVIATGHRAPVTSTERDHNADAELKKALGASLIAGDAIVSIDNVDKELGGEFLCQCITQRVLRTRILGESRNATVSNTTFFVANGNNVVLVGDLTRRGLVAVIDPKQERPELAGFCFDPVALALRARPLLVAKALTIMRAYQVSGENAGVGALGSFEDWSRIVRDALVWLGLADPVAVMDQVRDDDPVLSHLVGVVSAWQAVFGAGGVRVSDVVREIGKTTAAGEWLNEDLRAALHAVAGGRGKEDFINPERLGRWLQRNRGRVVAVESGRWRFEIADRTTHGIVWTLMSIAGGGKRMGSTGG